MGTTSSGRWTHLPWLLCGSVLLTFGQGHWPVPIAAWLAPVLLLRYTRNMRPFGGFSLFVVAHVAVWEIAYRGMVPLPPVARLAMEFTVSLLFGCVFLLDRAVSMQSCAFWTTLVFPAGWVAFEFACARLSPGGTWGSVAYTFADSIYFAQVVSLFGWTAITFLVGWVASVVNSAWDEDWSRANVVRGAGAATAVFGGVIIYGVVRVEFSPPSQQVSRVACIVAPSTFSGPHFDELWYYTRGVEQSEEAAGKAREQIAMSRTKHFELVEREAQSGAHLVVWAEANAVLTKQEEPRWIETAQQLARKYGTHIGMGMSVFRPATKERTENKFILVGPDGEILWDFLKATRVPGSHNIVGDGVLPVADTNMGRLTPAICFDMDFPQLIRQVGRNAADTLIAPSNDWTEARESHARMARIRAIENGVNLIRPTKDGISLVTDSVGRTLSRLDTDGNEQVSVAMISKRGRRTFYAYVGDVLPWAAISFMCLTSVVLIRSR